MMKHLSMFLVLTALCFTVTMTGCKGGGSQAVGFAAPGTDVSTPATGDDPDNGGNPGTGTGTLPTAGALAWDPVATNTDGTPLNTLSGYKIYYGAASGNYTGVLDVGLVTEYQLSSLAPGTYYFAVTAYDTSGSESSHSNEVSKTIQL